MLRDIKYINHMNETLLFGDTKLWIEESDLLDFAWTVKSKNNRITGFERKITSKKLTIHIKCGSEDEGFRKKNELFEVFEKDVLGSKHGRFVINGYYLKCFVTENKKSLIILRNGYMKVEVKVTTDHPYWVKETTTTFGYNIIREGKNLDFNNDFAYDYTSNMLGKELNNTGFVPANFRMLIYGPAENPSVNIGGHTYAVNTSVARNEYLAIDSISKTVVLKHTDGSETNCFNLRSRESYLFEKIPAGVNLVSITGNFKFDITLLEERSEPKWT